LSIERFDIRTHSRNCAVDITAKVAEAVGKVTADDGIAVIYVPHTTAGITVNEGADPDVMRDVLTFLEKQVPQSGDYRHAEGNSDSHIKASLVGASTTVLISAGRLLLGTWQKIFFMEFDGPRDRHFFVKIISS